MDGRAIPVIRLSIENMKHAIIQHMGVEGSELSDYIGEQCDKAVADYPWERTVKEVVNAAIQKGLERYFSCGPGYKAVEAAIEAALEELDGD